MTLPFLHEHKTATVLLNPDSKSREMGLFPGVTCTMIRNRYGENMLILATGATRFILTRPIARRIHIQRKEKTP